MYRRKVQVPRNAETLHDDSTDVVAEFVFAHETRIAGNRIGFEDSEAGPVAKIGLGDVTVEDAEAPMKFLREQRRMNRSPGVFPAVMRRGKDSPRLFVRRTRKPAVATIQKSIQQRLDLTVITAIVEQIKMCIYAQSPTILPRNGLASARASFAARLRRYSVRSARIGSILAARPAGRALAARATAADDSGSRGAGG